MTPESLQEYLNGKVPITKAMGMTVLEASPDKVVLSAPLSPNVNHSGTVFGGSAASAAVLSAWSLLYVRLDQEHINSNVVVHKCTMTYERPIVDRFTSETVSCGPAAWRAFLAALKEKGRGAIRLSSVLHCRGRKVGELEGDFVALRPWTD